MTINDLKDYLNNVLHKLSKENKAIFFLDDLNSNLLNYDTHSPTNSS